MKLLMICGSPRLKGSTSMYLLRALEEKLKRHEIFVCHASGRNSDEAETIIRNLPSSDAIIIAFPLYVDSIPSNMLGIFKKIEQANVCQKNTRVYAIINSGFYDARQNSIAIDMVWQWCGRCGLKPGYAIGLGAGEMAQEVPLGKGPSQNLGNAMNQLAKDIEEDASGETVFVEPNFPRFLYKAAAHSRWRREAKKNGLKISKLKQKEL